MKKFNKNATIEMSADSIAEMFLGSQHFLFDNREAFIETIIGTCIEKGTLGTVLGGFMGVVPKCKYAVGTDIICNNNTYDFHTIESQEKNDSVRRVIGAATIIDTDVYSDKPYHIEYWKTHNNGNPYLSTEWVRERDINGSPITPAL